MADDSRAPHGDPAPVPAVEVDGVSFAYRGGPPGLEDVSLTIEAGAFVGIAGPNGGGKTTLLRLILGLERPASGRIRLFGRVPGDRRRPRVGYVRQRAQLETGTPVTVRETVEVGRLAVRGPIGPLRTEDRIAVSRAIGRVGLADRADAPPWKLPLDSTRPSCVTTGLSTAAASSRPATIAACSTVSRTPPATWGAQRSE